MTAAPTTRDGEKQPSVRRSGADCLLEKAIKKMVIDEVTNHLSFWPQADIQDAIAAHVAQRVAEAVAAVTAELDATLASASESMKRDEMTIGLLKSNLFDEGANFSALTKEYEELGDTLTVTREERDKAEQANAALESENRALREALSDAINALDGCNLIPLENGPLVGSLLLARLRKALAPKEGKAE